MRRMLVVLLGLGMAVLTVACILIAVPLVGAYWFWVSDQGWSEPVAYTVFALPAVPLLTILFVLEMLDA